MTYEKNSDSFTGRPAGIVTIKKSVVDDVMYPPDYFFKKAKAAIKKVGDKIGDTKVATAIRETKAYQNVAKPILKVAVPVAAAVGLGALGAGAVKAIQAKKAAGAVGAKLAASPSPVTTIKPIATGKPGADIVSSVVGAKGTPVIKMPSGVTLKETLVNRASQIPGLSKVSILEKGKKLLDAGTGKLTDTQEILEQLRTTAETLPKTKEVKDAEELFLAPETSAGSSMPTLSAGGFSFSPMVVVGILLVVVVLGFLAKK
jgi:hypothetical protein